MKQYCSAFRSLLIGGIDLYWSRHGAVVVDATDQYWFIQPGIVQWSPKWHAVLVILLDFAACGNHKALRMRVKGVYWYK